jgi:hypothetical protein
MQELRLPPLLTMHNVSLPTFQQLARHFVDSLPSVELSFNVPGVLAQWVAGVVQVGLRGRGGGGEARALRRVNVVQSMPVGCELCNIAVGGRSGADGWAWEGGGEAWAWRLVDLAQPLCLACSCG